MVQGVFKRAFVAILLIATLVLPYSICKSQPRGNSHACCGSASQSPLSLKADCCTVRPPLAATEAQQVAPSPTSAAGENSFIPAAQQLIALHHPAPPAVFHGPPPPGKSILRI